jgi:putative transcriptional regulator
VTKFGQALLESAREAVAIAKGETQAARSRLPEAIDVAAIRKRSGMSQARFASRFGIPLGTLRDWEQHRRLPDQTARVLLSVIDREPAAVERALRANEAERLAQAARL